MFMSAFFLRRICAIAALYAPLFPLQAAESPTGNAFNPAISVILDGRYTNFDNDPEEYELPGFQLGGEAGLGEKGFALGHSELAMSANVDDWFYGNLNAAIHSHEGETELELEEAYIETLGLGNGLTLRGGRFFSGIGYLNAQHEHAWDFADAPLVYRGLFGGHLGDDGVQLRWVAPTSVYLLLGGEMLSGRTFPAGSEEGSAAHTLFAKLGGDVGASHSWQFGVSRWQADVEGRSGGGHAHEGEEIAGVVFAGDSAINGIDLVWKWAPNGNARERSLKFQAEYFRRSEKGDVTIEEDPPETTTYDGEQSGWYAQLVYKFRPQWRVGVRYDQLSVDNRGSDDEILGEAGLDDENHTPSRSSIMLDYARSEFSLVRLQFNRDDSGPESDTQIYLQYVMSLGAHGAHQF
jgi:hypothetical protein